MYTVYIHAQYSAGWSPLTVIYVHELSFDVHDPVCGRVPCRLVAIDKDVVLAGVRVNMNRIVAQTRDLSKTLNSIAASLGAVWSLHYGMD
jgi:hypothetical protein